MKNTKVTLVPLTADDREQFILDNQWAFKHGALFEFGERDNHIDNDGEIISRKTIEMCIGAEGAEVYRIVVDGRKVGVLFCIWTKKPSRANLILFSFHPRNTARASDTALGLRLRLSIPKRKYGKPAHPILTNGTSIFTSTSAVFK